MVDFHHAKATFFVAPATDLQPRNNSAQCPENIAVFGLQAVFFGFVVCFRSTAFL
jgi:hypothetical protein